ncbi:hypothetical protein EMCRGX_G010069, partial [Ephydatia muelleri]
MKLITRPELHVDTQCTSSVLRSHSDYKSTIAGPSKLCIDAGFEQLNEAASSDENDEMDPDEVCLYEEIMRLMSTIDNKGNYKPFKSNVAAMVYLLAHSPRPMVSSTLLRWHHILYYSHILHGQINLEFVLYTLASFCAIRVIVYEVSSSRVCQ